MQLSFDAHRFLTRAERAAAERSLRRTDDLLCPDAIGVAWAPQADALVRALARAQDHMEGVAPQLTEVVDTWRLTQGDTGDVADEVAAAAQYFVVVGEAAKNISAALQALRAPGVTEKVTREVTCAASYASLLQAARAIADAVLPNWTHLHAAMEMVVAQCAMDPELSPHRSPHSEEADVNVFQHGPPSDADL
jgi:hypothetical protein